MALLGTCGGFQHVVLEFARNVVGFEDAQHAGYDPYASTLFITPLSCSLVGQTMTVQVTGSAAQVAAWSASAVVAGRADAPFVRGTEPGPWPTLTQAERALNPPMPGTIAPPPPCRVDHEAEDGDELDFAGDVAAEFHGEVIVGVFNTDRELLRRSLARLAGTGAQIAGFGHGEAVLAGAAERLATCTDPLG